MNQRDEIMYDEDRNDSDVEMIDESQIQSKNFTRYATDSRRLR